MRGTVSGVGLWVRADVRARWRSLLGLGLIAGITGGLALGCVAGALRTGTALDRLRARTDASDAVVFSSQVGEYHPDWTTLAARPEVQELAPWSLVFGLQGDDPEGLIFAPSGSGGWFHSVDHPVVTEGRMFDPTTDDEVVVTADVAHDEHISVGDTIPFTPYTVADQEGEAGSPHGPPLTLRVVGLVRSSIEPLFTGGVIASPGLLTKHPDVFFAENAVVRLRPGPGTIDDLRRHVDTDVTDGAPVLDLRAVGRRVTTTTDVERTALLVLALVIAAAGVILAGQAVGRSGAGIGTDAPALGAIGLTRGDMAMAAALGHVPAALVAGLASLATMLGLSASVPFGLAGRLEPDQGIRLDLPLAGFGTLLLVVAVLLASAGAGWRAAVPRAKRSSTDGRDLLGWLRRHSSPPVGIGATLALRPGRGPRGVPVRPALLGAIVGVLGIAGAVTVDAGLQDALSHPERAGVVWDAQVAPGAPDAAVPGGIDPTFVAAVRARPEVGDVALGNRTSVPVGTIGVPTYSLRSVGEPTSIELTTIDGRPPRMAGEAAVGPETARALGVSIGDEVDVGPSATPTTIVGTALFPTDVHSEFDEGLWLTPEDLDVASSVASREPFLAVRFAPGVTTDDGVAALQAVAAPSQGGASPVDVPPELINLRDVRPLPRWLAGFLALLAVAALLHVLASTARLWSHDFAVLRAIGLTRRGTRLVLHVQSAAVFAVGLLVGLPLGVAAGRLGWRLIADRVPLRLVDPWAAVAIALLIPAALVLSQVLALGPGRRVRRLQPGDVLRTE